MGLFKFIAKSFSLGPAVKVWVDSYNIFYEKKEIGLSSREKAEDYFNYIHRMNIIANRDGDNTRFLSFTDLESYLENPNNVSFNPLLDLPSFLALMMYFEIPLIREAFREQPGTVNSLLEIIYEVSIKNAPNGVISKKSEFLHFSRDILSFLSSTLRFLN